MSWREMLRGQFSLTLRIYERQRLKQVRYLRPITRNGDSLCLASSNNEASEKQHIYTPYRAIDDVMSYSNIHYNIPTA